ncbi:MAG: DUF637 domain-containing protein [Desulfovibrio sp.]
MGEVLENKDVDWQAVAEVHKHWEKSDGGMGGPGMALVSMVVAVALSWTGVGSYIAGTTLGMAEGAMSAAVAAGFNTLISQATMQLFANGGDIGATLEALASEDTIRSLAVAMITAGLTSKISDMMSTETATDAAAGVDGSVGAEGAIDGASNVADAANGIGDAAGQATEQVSKIDKFINELVAKLKDGAISTGIHTGVDTAINGGDLGENLVANMQGAAVGALGATLASEIGTAFKNGKINTVTHKIAHAALGGALAAASDGDITSGAMGAVIGEITAGAFVENFISGQLEDPERMMNLSKKEQEELDDQLKKMKDVGVDLGKLSAGISAALVGGDIDAAAGSAQNAAENNAIIIVPILLELVDKGLQTYDAY